MKKKFVFINLIINVVKSADNQLGLINHGIAFLVPILKKYDYEVEVIQLDKEINNGVFKNKIKELSPSIVGFSCTSCQFKYLIKYSKSLEEIQDILLIAGGVHPTIDPEGTLLQTSLDGVCIGEGEIPLDNLLKNIENKKDIFDTWGFYWNVNGKIKKNSVPQFITDLSILEFPDYSVFGRNALVYGIYNNAIPVILNRGCPYPCTYCCNKRISESYPSDKNYFRVPPVEYAIRLLEYVIKQYSKVNLILFADDNFIANEEWLFNFLKQYKIKINLPYILNYRIEGINPGCIRELKKSGCKLMMIGIESGNEYLRNNLLKRKHNNKLIIEKSRMIKKAGIKLNISTIVGFPFETKKQMEETLRLSKKISPYTGACTFFYPYKGTELYEICKKNNLLKSEKEMIEIPNNCTKPSIKMTKKQEKDCIKINKKINSYFFRQSYGLITYYFLRPIWKLSKFLKTKSKSYEKFINFLKKPKILK